MAGGRLQAASTYLRDALDDIVDGEYAKSMPFSSLKDRAQRARVDDLSKCMVVLSGGEEDELFKKFIESATGTARGRPGSRREIASKIISVLASSTAIASSKRSRNPFLNRFEFFGCPWGLASLPPRMGRSFYCGAGVVRNLANNSFFLKKIEKSEKNHTKIFVGFPVFAPFRAPDGKRARARA